jgi:hypothetical protein
VSVLSPRLSQGSAEVEYDRYLTDGLIPLSSHPAQVYAAVGGRRLTADELLEFASSVRTTATQFGYPKPAPAAKRIAFDREASRVVRGSLDFTWAEAGSAAVWSFHSLVLLPDVTAWRFSDSSNRERWIASDLTRHTWARLWWQAEVFDADPGLLDQLGEADLNQLLERRSIGGDKRLLATLGRRIVEADRKEVSNRDLVRDSTARMMRRLAFIDPRSLGDEDLERLSISIVDETLSALRDAQRG